jgi:formylglycine-generating enzyme required for sulfatase activity/predicted Ser/Thr protein kinase
VKTCPNCFGSYDDVVGFCPRDGAALRSSAGLEPGTVIRKKYEILSEIGRGGMGVVYRARHLIWNEEKALKVLVAAGAAQQGLKGLMAEALVMRQLQHPNIVRVEDADYTEDDQPFVVMEYVDGQSLGQKLKGEGPLAPELALQIAAQTCSALSAAHQKGIVHRDIKPQNVLLAKGADGSETVKIIDFGIAKVREEAGLGFTGMMTGTTGFFVGTPGYASPEQALGMRGRELDGRTDLYSLGLVLYEMLTGRLPFAGDTPVALLVQRLQVQPLPPDQLRPDLHIPPDVSKLVMTALEKDRENRYRSAEEMERAIAAVLEARRDERREQERVETARLAVAEAERRRQERERAEAARLAAEGADRARRQREAAEGARLAAEQETSSSEAQSGRVGPAGPEHRKGATTVLSNRELSRRRRIGFVIAAVILALVAIGFVVARSLTEKTAHGVREQKAKVETPSRTTAPPPLASEQSNEKPATGALVEKKPEPGAQQSGSSPQAGSAAKAEAPPPPATEQKNEKPTAGTLVEKKPKELSGQQSGTRAGPAEKAEVPPRLDTRAEAARAVGTETAPVGPRAGMTKVNPKDELRYVWIPPGTFTMGCSSGDSACDDVEKPAHQVTITKGFWLGQTEVTYAAYQHVVGTNPSHVKGANLPVDYVSWSEAEAYCQAVGGRLPTEAEWEYAARAGNGESLYGDIDRIAWSRGNSGEHTHEVAQKQPNVWGLYDMLGNVWEWTADWFENYAPGPAVDPTGPASGRYRAARGDSWEVDPADGLRVSDRVGIGPGRSAAGTIGMRCVGE